MQVQVDWKIAGYGASMIFEAVELDGKLTVDNEDFDVFASASDINTLKADIVSDLDFTFESVVNCPRDLLSTDSDLEMRARLRAVLQMPVE